MIIKCKYCKREFDTQRQRRQHEKDAHKESWVEYTTKQLANKAASGKD